MQAAKARAAMIPLASTIPVKKETKERLRSFGKKDETFDQILRRPMSLAEHEGFMMKQYHRLKRKKEFAPLDEL